MSDIDTNVLLIMSGCAFDTIEQMDDAYKLGSVALEGYRQKIIQEAADVAYRAVESHLWDSTVAERVRAQIISSAKPTT